MREVGPEKIILYKFLDLSPEARERVLFNKFRDFFTIKHIEFDDIPRCKDNFVIQFFEDAIQVLIEKVYESLKDNPEKYYENGESYNGID